MYAHVINLTLKPEFRGADFVDRLSLKVPQMVKDILGFIRASYMGLREDGKCAVSACYESAEAADNAKALLKALWDEFEPIMEQKPHIEAYTVFMEIEASR
jgi:hypothetical protein